MMLSSSSPGTRNVYFLLVSKCLGAGVDPVSLVGRHKVLIAEASQSTRNTVELQNRCRQIKRFQKMPYEVRYQSLFLQRP